MTLLGIKSHLNKELVGIIILYQKNKSNYILNGLEIYM